MKRDLHPPQSAQARDLSCVPAPSSAQLQQGPWKSLPEFPVWPLVNLYWSGNAKNPSWYHLGNEDPTRHMAWPKYRVENPLDSKEITPLNPKGNQPWISIGRTDAEAPIHWPSNEKSQLIGKDPDAGKDWGQERVTEDEMVGWHHWLNGHEFQQTPGDRERQWSSPWGYKELDTTWQLNNNNMFIYSFIQEMFIELLLCSRHCSRCLDATEKKKNLLSEIHHFNGGTCKNKTNW